MTQIQLDIRDASLAGGVPHLPRSTHSVRAFVAGSLMLAEFLVFWPAFHLADSIAQNTLTSLASARVIASTALIYIIVAALVRAYVSDALTSLRVGFETHAERASRRIMSMAAAA